jgi:hypothetical protein
MKSLLMRFFEGLDHHGQDKVKQKELPHDDYGEGIDCTDDWDVQVHSVHYL